MKKKALSLVLALAMTVSVLSGMTLTAFAETVTDQAGNSIEVVGENLVKNPSFEQGLGDSPWADPNPQGGWTIWGMNNNNIESKPEGLIVPDGSKVFHVVRAANANDSWATLKQTVALEAGKSYIFTAELAAPHNAGFSIGVTIYDDNSRISNFSREKDANGVLEFQKVSATFTVPAEAENPRADISCGLGETSNQKYIDDVRLYEIADPSKVEIEEKEGKVFTGDVTVKLRNETKELELKLVGDNGTPTSRYDNRSKYMNDIMFNVNRDFGSADTSNTTRTQIPVDIYDEETLEAAKNIVKADPKSNPILSTDYIDSYIEEMVALRPGYMNYMAQAMEMERMGITLVPVSNPWWQYMRLEEGQTEYTEEQWRYFYKQLWGDAWRHGFAKGYIYAKYFGQTNYNMGNEPDNKDNGQTKFIDWKLYALEAEQLADGFRTGVEAAGYSRDEAQTWGPTLAGWNTGAWDTIAQYGDGAIDVYDYHTYGGGPSAHKTRIQNFKTRIENYDSDGQTEKISASEFNWKLSGDSFDWLDKMPGCISHIQIMREQALQGLYASIRFSFGEMFFKDNATGRYLIPERMYYAIRLFNRTLTEGNVLVEYDLLDAGSNQEFFVTKGENSYFVHLINNTSSDKPTSLTVDLSDVGVADGSAAVLREMSEEKNDEAVAFAQVADGQVKFENLKGGAMYLI
ncbi:MAG: carbohydrate binding domain-containing protein, partial [Clostridia bacterium]